MKRILTLLISFFVLFNLSTNLFAFSVKNANDFDFDNFALEQIQKTFTSSLFVADSSSTSKTQNESSQCDFIFSINDFNFVCQNFYSNIKNLNVVPLYKLNDFTITNKNVCKSIFSCNNIGLTKYKINFNSYIATVIPDNNKIYINNIKC